MPELLHGLLEGLAVAAMLAGFAAGIAAFLLQFVVWSERAEGASVLTSFVSVVFWWDSALTETGRRARTYLRWSMLAFFAACIIGGGAFAVLDAYR